MEDEHWREKNSVSMLAFFHGVVATSSRMSRSGNTIPPEEIFAPSFTFFPPTMSAVNFPRKCVPELCLSQSVVWSFQTEHYRGYDRPIQSPSFITDILRNSLFTDEVGLLDFVEPNSRCFFRESLYSSLVIQTLFFVRMTQERSDTNRGIILLVIMYQVFQANVYIECSLHS